MAASESLSKVIGSVIRTWAAFAAGGLVASGAVDPEVLNQWVDVTTQLIAGIILAGGVQLWSLVEKLASRVSK